MDMKATFHGATFSLTLKISLGEKKVKIIIIKFYKIVKILWAPWLAKTTVDYTDKPMEKFVLFK